MNTSFLFASCNALVGLIVGVWIAWNATGEGWKIFPLFSTLGAFLVSLLVHYLFTIKLEKNLHFILLGSIVVFFSHYMTFYIQFIYANFSNSLGTFQSSLGEPPAGLLDALWVSLLFSFFSFYLVGWLTFPAGWILAYFFKNKS